MSNMLTPIVIEGRAARDPELTVNQETGAKYVRLSVIQNKGYTKESEHSVCFSCFFNGGQGERLIKAKVKQGNLLTIVGDFDSKEYMRQSRENPNEQVHDRSLEVSVSNWSYTPQNKPKDETSNSAGTSYGQNTQGLPPAQNTPPAMNNQQAQGQQARNNQYTQNQGMQQGQYGNNPAYPNAYGGSQTQMNYAQNQQPAGNFAGYPQQGLPFPN
ncbi:hypothetical protein CE91St62_39190 [Lachnospiraceae bacterium]|nr:hypothetical protein CE91St61_39320 [Lachnospiraceae bacterium]BDF39858.1 hypothetical protein CE91St62_39190 [Lachnospiraceae bacterium]